MTQKAFGANKVALDKVQCLSQRFGTAQGIGVYWGPSLLAGPSCVALTGAGTGAGEALSLELAFSMLDAVARAQPVGVTPWVALLLLQERQRSAQAASGVGRAPAWAQGGLRGRMGCCSQSPGCFPSRKNHPLGWQWGDLAAPLLCFSRGLVSSVTGQRTEA